MAPYLSLTRRLLALALLAAVVLLVGCGDDSGSTPEPGTLDKLFTYPAITGCGTCHDGNGTGPDLRTKASFHRDLVGKRSSQFDWNNSSNTVLLATCGTNNLLVKDGSPAESALMATLFFHDYSTLCPDITTTAYAYHETLRISQSMKQDLELWIENGAPR